MCNIYSKCHIYKLCGVDAKPNNMNNSKIITELIFILFGNNKKGLTNEVFFPHWLQCIVDLKKNGIRQNMLPSSQKT